MLDVKWEGKEEELYVYIRLTRRRLSEKEGVLCFWGFFFLILLWCKQGIRGQPFHGRLGYLVRLFMRVLCVKREERRLKKGEVI